MQRDFDLVVTVLGALRDADSVSLTQKEIEAAVQASMPDSASATLIAHHLNILLDAGLVAAVTQGTGRESNWRITWKGHDALEQEEDADDDIND